MQPETQITQWSRKLDAQLRSLLPSNPTEADFRRVIDPLLDEFCAEVGLNPLAHAEYTLATGRADAVFNRLVIEYERPGTLKKTPDAATRHAVQQVKDYITGLARRERREMERFAGVAFDGHFLIFVRFIAGKWLEEPPTEANVPALERFLTWLAGLASGIALTSENLNRDFAIEQLRTQNILRGLYQALASALANREGLVVNLFAQWRLFFSEAIDYSEAFGGRKLDPLRKWVRKAGFEVDSAEEAERFFFVLHTYFALLVKLLAWLALSRHLGVRLGPPSFAGLAIAEGETLRRRLEEMERGGIFRAYGILNLLEGDFFAWYLYAWNEQIEGALREILKRLDEYDPTTLTIIPEETRDLFKKLYHYLLPREIRHNLGEYYTPDWLARRLLVQDPVKRRGIDEEALQTRYPRTYGYLKRFEPVLRKRASRGISDMLQKGAPFYTMFAVGDYTFAPWKVVWPWISKGVRTAVVGLLDGKQVIPEHNVFLVECEKKDEAFYVCGLMNSSPGDFSIRSFFSTGGGGIGSPVVLEHIRIPRFDPGDPVHRRLAALSEAAHQAAQRGDQAGAQRPAPLLKHIEAEIDQQAAKLWGLSDAELREIQASLRELGGEFPSEEEQ